MLVLTLAHDFDHVRQDRPLGMRFHAIGVYTLVLAVVMLWAAMRHAKFAPALAIFVGLQNLFGLLLVHVVHRWWYLSDPYGEAHVDGMSWAVVVLLMLAGAVLAANGWISLKKTPDSHIA